MPSVAPYLVLVVTRRSLSNTARYFMILRPTKYRPIKCAVIIYGYDADGYKGCEQIFADVKTALNVLK